MWLNPKNSEKVLAELMRVRKPALNVISAPIVQDYAKEIRRRLATKSKSVESYVCEPLLNCSVLDQVSAAPIIAWLYFNPIGPTYSQLCVVPVPDANEMLLTFYGDHPLDTHRTVFGLLPASHAKVFLKALKIALQELAVTNGVPSCPLWGSLPTSVLHQKNWCGGGEAPLVSPEFAREFLWTHAKDSCQGNELIKSCYYMQEFHGDPWNRTADEFAGSHERMLGKSEQVLGPQSQSIERNEFDRWFDLVTDSRHVDSEFDNFKIAWSGAVEHTNTEMFRISKLDALLRLQKLFLWEEIAHRFRTDEIADNPELYIAMALRYREALKENIARRMANQAVRLAQDSTKSNQASALMQEAVKMYPELKNEYEDK